MAARYWVFIADQLVEGHQQWLDVLRPVERLPEMEGGLDEDPNYPEAHWWLLEDDDAPAELNHRRVELTFARVDMRPVITDRKVIG